MRMFLFLFVVACGDARSDDSSCGNACDHLTSAKPQVLAVGARGELAAIGLAKPWPVLAQARLDTPVHSVRFHGGRYFVVHPAPANRVSVVAAADLSVKATIALEANSDPRDIAIVDANTAVISQFGRAALVKLDLRTLKTNGVVDVAPGATMLGSCGSRVFVQLPQPPALAVIEGERIVKTIALEAEPKFDMQIDCSAGKLLVAEPAPVMLGGSRLTSVDLNSLSAQPFPIGDVGQIGAFVFVSERARWLIGHTELGPAPSTHLNFLTNESQVPRSVWDTFADEHIDNLAYDAATSQVFFPDGCTAHCQHGNSGVAVFDAASSQRLTEKPIDVGFAPVEVVIGRPNP